MFFSDYGQYSRIEKASLDGQDRVVIVYKGLLRVISLTVDTDNNKLYWADLYRQTLEGCDYDGSNRRVIRRMNRVSMTGVAYHQVIIGIQTTKKSTTIINIIFLSQSITSTSIHCTSEIQQNRR